MKLGKLTDWGQYCNLNSGYLLMEGNEADKLTNLMKWTHILFDVKPVANVDQTIEVWRKACNFPFYKIGNHYNLICYCYMRGLISRNKIQITNYG